MTKLYRTDSNNRDFKELVKLLDEGLKVTDGDEHEFYDQFNQIDSIKYVVVAYQNDIPVGCGAIKKYSDDAYEVKRMFVKHECRGQGIASIILKELENWTLELSSSKCILETGVRQPDAISLYRKNGYQSIPNYGQYEGVENSLCFEKFL